MADQTIAPKYAELCERLLEIAARRKLAMDGLTGHDGISEALAEQATFEHALFTQAATAIADLQARIEHLTRGCAKQNDEVSQALGKALGYPWFKNDQANFPGATEANGVCVGEHVAESLADEAAAKIADLQAGLERVKGALTPSSETKAAHMGEFSFPITEWDHEAQEEVTRMVPVPWDTVKQIMAAIKACAALGDGGASEGESRPMTDDELREYEDERRERWEKND